MERGQASESDLLAIAKEHVLMTRMDKSGPTGPVLVKGEGSVVGRQRYVAHAARA
jgi:hypothetical protein